MEKTNILITLAFDDLSTKNVDTELEIQNDIVKLLQNYIKEKRISHFVVADNDAISEKLKASD